MKAVPIMNKEIIKATIKSTVPESIFLFDLNFPITAELQQFIFSSIKEETKATMQTTDYYF